MFESPNVIYVIPLTINNVNSESIAIMLNNALVNDGTTHALR